MSSETVDVGGHFASVGGQSRNFIAALDAETAEARPWDPNASAAVRALAVSGGTVYAGGSFTSIGGQSRNAIAALDAGTGEATIWDPHAARPVAAAWTSTSVPPTVRVLRTALSRLRADARATKAVAPSSGHDPRLT